MKEGSRVKIYLDKEIEKAKSGKYPVCPSVLELWEAINGNWGTVTQIIGDNEIWVIGDRTRKERMFTKTTLKLTCAKKPGSNNRFRRTDNE